MGVWLLLYGKDVQRRELYRKFDARDERGRTLDAFIVGDIAVLYWIAFADRHVKVLAMTDAG
jgi:hypothetical protein